MNNILWRGVVRQDFRRGLFGQSSTTLTPKKLFLRKNSPYAALNFLFCVFSFLPLLLLHFNPFNIRNDENILFIAIHIFFVGISYFKNDFDDFAIFLFSKNCFTFFLQCERNHDFFSYSVWILNIFPPSKSFIILYLSFIKNKKKTSLSFFLLTLNCDVSHLII